VLDRFEESDEVQKLEEELGKANDEFLSKISQLVV
jgi:hypothetical protein